MIELFSGSSSYCARNCWCRIVLNWFDILVKPSVIISILNHFSIITSPKKSHCFIYLVLCIFQVQTKINLVYSMTKFWLKWSMINFINFSTENHLLSLFFWIRINPVSANFTKWSNLLKQFVDELFECAWPFCEIGA